MENKNLGEECIGQVVRITSEKELIINIGSNEVTVGDTILVYRISDEIFDLDGTSLGVYEDVKAELKVTHTTRYYSICRDTREEQSNAFSLADALISKRTFDKDLPVDEKDIKPVQFKDAITIKIGDPIKKG